MGDLAPYQRIIFDGKLLQEGKLDTIAKFKQLTENIDLADKRVLEIGCRRGMMCHLAWKRGAKSVLGVDVYSDVIHEAERLKYQYYPDAPVSFGVREASKVPGQYDVIIMSSVFHWLRNTDTALKQISRVLDPKGVFILDVWIDEGNRETCTLGESCHTICLVPTRTALRKWLEHYFADVQFGGWALAANETKRLIVECRKPIKRPIKAVLIYGDRLMGKSTLARAYEDGLGFNRLELDFICMRHAVCIAPDPDTKQTYWEFIDQEVRAWLRRWTNTDVVLDGLTFGHDQLLEPTRAMLRELGWQDIEEIHITERNFDLTWEMRGTKT